MKTAEVKNLVIEVLNSLPKPFSNHIIDEVFGIIEKSPSLLTRYETLCSNLGNGVVNNWGGKWIALELGKSGEKQVPSKKSTLITSYSILDTDFSHSNTKLDRPLALKLLSEYYKENKERLPRNISDYREEIINLILTGLTAEGAFSEVLRINA